VDESALGKEAPYGKCGRALGLNTFTITGDWRALATAWAG